MSGLIFNCRWDQIEQLTPHLQVVTQFFAIRYHQVNQKLKNLTQSSLNVYLKFLIILGYWQTCSNVSSLLFYFTYNCFTFLAVKLCSTVNVFKPYAFRLHLVVSSTRSILYKRNNLKKSFSPHYITLVSSNNVSIYKNIISNSNKMLSLWTSL